MLYQAYILLDQILLSHLNCAIIGADIQDYEPLSLAILCGPYVITALKFNIASKWHLYVTKMINPALKIEMFLQRRNC
jgi:hypothetical protein